MNRTTKIKRPLGTDSVIGSTLVTSTISTSIYVVRGDGSSQKACPQRKFYLFTYKDNRSRHIV